MCTLNILGIRCKPLHSTIAGVTLINAMHVIAVRSANPKLIEHTRTIPELEDVDLQDIPWNARAIASARTLTASAANRREKLKKKTA